MASPVGGEPPLVVDLDGTLIKSDLLVETLIDASRRSPWVLLLLPLWLLRGRASLKRQLAMRAGVKAATLPYRPEVVTLMDEARRAGRRTVIATASDMNVAREVARHVGCDDLLASDGKTNMKGHHKRDALVHRYGEGGFDYVGDSHADVEVWRAARQALVVGGNPGVTAAARRVAPEARELPADPRRPSAWLRALRLHQWPKNLLVLVPLLTAHRWNDAEALRRAMFAFLAFCLVASAIYVANDLLDLASDRRHDSKKRRPFASGELPLIGGVAIVPLLLAAGLGLALATTTPLLAAAVATYVVVALAYSLRLKQRAGVDVLVIAALYTLRIVGGALAVQVVLSHWLAAFSLFFFLSLALAKRHGELAKHLARAEVEAPVPGRGYLPTDAPLVASLGTASGYLAVLVLALYINSETVAVLYSRPWLLWALPVLVLYWITRAWLLAHRGVLAEDPLSFALRDRVSYAVVAGMLACVVAAT